MNMRKILFGLIFLTTTVCYGANAPQPPYAVTDPAASDDLRDLYQQVSNLNAALAAQAAPAATTITGEIRLWPTGTAPTSWFICDGTAYSRTTYAALFAVVGTTFGGGDGSTTFNVPNFQRRSPVGAGGSGTGVLANTIGSTGGEETHTLTTAEMPSHTHTEVGRIGAAGGANIAVRIDGSGDTVSNTTYHQTLSTGGDGAHNIRTPSLVINYIIKQ